MSDDTKWWDKEDASPVAMREALTQCTRKLTEAEALVEALQERAQKTESRVERLTQQVFDLGEQMEDFLYDAHMEEPPPGHVHVLMSKDDAEWFADPDDNWVGKYERLSVSCFEALENSRTTGEEGRRND